MLSFIFLENFGLSRHHPSRCAFRSPTSVTAVVQAAPTLTCHGETGMGLSYRCTCGEHFKIYVPKNRVYGDAVSRAVDWQAIDDRKEADG
jgi:hypothetical protein